MSFPPGRILLLVLLMATLGALGLVLHPPSGSETDQIVWVFDSSHADTYRLPTDRGEALTNTYKKAIGRSAAIKLIPSRALDARLLCLILGNIHSESQEVPDVVEIEIGSVGKYFRARPEQNGLYPLDQFIANDPLASDLSPARLATWTSGGHVFGIPCDVHPVTVSYRKDLFDQAGVDLKVFDTWPAFREACLRYQQFWRLRGQKRVAMQLSRWNASDLMVLLHQQHIELIDAAGRPSLSDPRIAQTIAFYAQLVAGPEPLGTPVADDMIARDLAEGHTACVLTPDWRIAYLRSNPNLLGRLAMMPLPRFEPGDARTASWGGTMAAIPKNCRDPEASWQLLRFLQLSPEALYARQYHTSVLPAVTSAWDDEVWDRPNPLFGGQAIGRLYAQLARELPVQRTSPYSTLLSQSIAAVLTSAQARLESSGPEGLEAFCRERLQTSQTALNRLLEFAEGG